MSADKDPCVAVRSRGAHVYFKTLCIFCGAKTPDPPPDDIDSRDKPCTCNAQYGTPECERHGIAADNARQNRYWQRVGGHD